ncbi:MAG: tRNA (adenosine(37)-N6)-dimethylallyltransferase MiaA [Flavobacteriales bacterium]|nr:tRNA (adenosine(37)-N6)-dimethylallyltransferase MiaA [Flavobacteriales bacterium]
MENEKYLVVVAGPTSVGKTALSVQLALNLETEILSFDSRQFYREMKIGTAPPSEKALSLVPHHFIFHKSIHDEYSVGAYEHDALQKLGQLFHKKDVVVAVGGSGLYMDGLTKGLDEFPKVEPGVRLKLNQEFRKFGIEHLQRELANADPEYYAEVDLKNPARLIRALEITRQTGKPYSGYRKQDPKTRFFKTIKIALNLNRTKMYDRINQRVDEMMLQGLYEEAKELYPFREKNALQTVGYQELFDYLGGKWNLETAVEEIKKNTRRYAKRQLTYLRGDESVHWFKPNDLNAVLQTIESVRNEGT